MLIVLDDSIIDQIQSNDEKVINMIENIRGCMYEGNHYILASRKLCAEVMKNTHVSNPTKMCFSYLQDNFAILQGIRSIVTEYIKVCSHVDEYTLAKEKNKNVILVPVDYFYKASRLNKTSLICESTTDSEFYNSVSQSYLKCIKKQDCINLNFEFAEGGGNTITNSYKNIVLDNKKLALVIVDSDRENENSQIGKTASKILNNYKHDHLNSKLFVLKEREKENLIPFNVYEAFTKDRKNCFLRLNELNKLSESKDKIINDLNFYGDIKSGIKIPHISKILGYREELFKVLYAEQMCEQLKEYRKELKEYAYSIEHMERTIKHLEGAGYSQPLLQMINNQAIKIEEQVNKYIMDCEKEQKVKKQEKFIEELSSTFNLICKNLDLDFLKQKINDDRIDLRERQKLKNWLESLNTFYDELDQNQNSSWSEMLSLLISWGCSYKFQARS